VGVPILQVRAWQQVPGLFHAFLGRRGGVSTGAYASLNLGQHTEDDPAAVARNWACVEALTPGMTVVTMRQVHGTEIVHVSGKQCAVGDADGMYTKVTGVLLGVLTADCVPLLMIVPRVKAAVAVHAGWRGTLAGVVPAAVRAVCSELGVRPTDLWAALGPSIGPCCYEVEATIGDKLINRWGTMHEAWYPDGSRGMLDLRAANRAMLLAAGVPGERVDEVGPCTSCRHDEFFSHRRSGGHTGRHLSLVGWRPDP